MQSLDTRDRIVTVGGPWFEDFERGRVFDGAPPLTITDGHAAAYQALFGDRLRLPLDHPLAAAVTGRREPLAHPGLVCNIVIGHSTEATQRVRANLFYRRLVLQRAVHIGDTLRTTTTVTGLKQNSAKPGRPATGLVALRIRSVNQHGEEVLDFWRCPMVPLRDPAARTGHRDTFDDLPDDVGLDAAEAVVPASWSPAELGPLREGARSFDDLHEGMRFAVDGRDPVTSAPEFARLTLNQAAVHYDAAVTGTGERLVYGGHTIAIAGAHASRALPSMVTILAWRSCDHTGPVFEGDLLRTDVSIEALRPLEDGSGLAQLRAVTVAARAGSPSGEEVPVLDWRFIALVA